jgi:hypothetical protein
MRPLNLCTWITWIILRLHSAERPQNRLLEAWSQFRVVILGLDLVETVFQKGSDHNGQSWYFTVIFSSFESCGALFLFNGIWQQETLGIWHGI